METVLTVEETNKLSISQQIEKLSMKLLDQDREDLSEFNKIIEFLKPYEGKKLTKTVLRKLNIFLDRPYTQTEYGECMNSKGYFSRQICQDSCSYIERLDYSNSGGRQGLSILLSHSEKCPVININFIIEENPAYSKTLQKNIGKAQSLLSYRKHKELAKRWDKLNNAMYEYKKLFNEFPHKYALSELGLKDF